MIDCIVVAWWNRWLRFLIAVGMMLLLRTLLLSHDVEVYLEDSDPTNILLEKPLDDIPARTSKMMKNAKNMDPLQCEKDLNWVTCKGHYCKVIDEYLDIMKDIKCVYTDILWQNDYKNIYGKKITVQNRHKYHLKKSDFVQINCTGKNILTDISAKWNGFGVGVRDSESIKLQLGWDNLNRNAMKYNVLIYGYNSLSHNTVIQKLPKTYRYLKEILGAYILERYNILGDGTKKTFIPLLTGHTESELPPVRRSSVNGTSVSIYPFIWKLYRKMGYMTAFNEDHTNYGTFSFGIRGFDVCPTDHYMRTLFLELKKWSRKNTLCMGSEPRHNVMLDYIKQLFGVYHKVPKFVFGFNGELSRDDNNQIQYADDEQEQWLRDLKTSGILNNTILIFMSDHGHRLVSIRDSVQGKQKERLPFISFVLPPDMSVVQSVAVRTLKENTKRLTTPFDVHATLLDILGEVQPPHLAFSNKPPRGLSLFNPILENRTCQLAGITPHWCACLTWYLFDANSPFAHRLGMSLIQAINALLTPFRTMCAELMLFKVEWAQSLTPTKELMNFLKNIDRNGHLPVASMSVATTVYQIKIQTTPGKSLFEASLKHIHSSDTIVVNLLDISRINMYGNQSQCIYETQPQLRKYCYCRSLSNQRIKNWKMKLPCL